MHRVTITFVDFKVQRDGRGRSRGWRASRKQVVQCIVDSAPTCNLTPDADGLINQSVADP